MLSEAGLQLDLADFGLLLGRKLVELNCYYSDQLTGVLNLIGGCPTLEKLNLGNCTKVKNYLLLLYTCGILFFQRTSKHAWRVFGSVEE